MTLAKASAEPTKANCADTEGIVTGTLDSASFNAWFTAFTAGDANAERLAAKRMRPGYQPAFNAWLATDPAHNPNAPRGPAYMPQYVITQERAPRVHDAQAAAAFSKGADAGSTADKYIRDTVFLATVLCAGSLMCLRSALRRMSQIEQAALAHRGDRSGARGVGVSALISESIGSCFVGICCRETDARLARRSHQRMEPGLVSISPTP